jgi:hypothetical protein
VLSFLFLFFKDTFVLSCVCVNISIESNEKNNKKQKKKSKLFQDPNFTVFLEGFQQGIVRIYFTT